MAVIEDSNSSLSCVRCQAAFPLTSAFCTNCGVERAIALGNSLSAEDIAARKAEARLVFEREQQEESLRLAEARKAAQEEKRELRKAAIRQNRKKIEVSLGCFAVIGIYAVMQIVVWSKVSPDSVANRYFTAISTQDVSALSDQTLFPNDDPSYVVAPDYVLSALSRNTAQTADYTLSWKPWSGKAHAGNGNGDWIEIRSDDGWSFIFRTRHWRVASQVPKLEISAAKGLSSKVKSATIATHKISSGTLRKIEKRPLKFITWPGELSMSTKGRGFVSNWKSNYYVSSDSVTSATLNRGKLHLTSAQYSKARNSASNRFSGCLRSDEPCGNYLSMSDFNIDYPTFYEDYSASDTATNDGCSHSDTTFFNSKSAVITYSCSGSVSRSVTWLIWDYYYLPDDYEYDYGSADITTTVKVYLRYSDTKKSTYVKRVTYE